MRRANANGPFKSRTYSIFRHMADRAKGSPQGRTLDFDLEDFREVVELAVGFGLCPYCRCVMTAQAKKPTAFSLDHKVPVSRGGSFGRENVQVICSADNKAKGDLTDAEYRVLLRKLEEAEAETRNFEMKGKVLTGLRVAQSFRQGANRRAKKR